MLHQQRQSCLQPVPPHTQSGTTPALPHATSKQQGTETSLARAQAPENTGSAVWGKSLGRDGKHGGGARGQQG